jgi:hypothetical protein
MSRSTMCICGVLLVVAFVEYLNFSGFCYAQRRYPSDAELIAMAVADNLRRHGPDSDRRKIYRSLDDFYRENPDCCEVNRWSSGAFGNPILFRLFGVYRAMVDVVYRINDGAGVDNFYGSTASVDSCGAVQEMHGQPWATNHEGR